MICKYLPSIHLQQTCQLWSAWTFDLEVLLSELSHFCRSCNLHRNCWCMLKMKEVIECICFTFSFHQFLLSVCDHLTSNAIPLFFYSWPPLYLVGLFCSGVEKRKDKPPLEEIKEKEEPPQANDKPPSTPSTPQAPSPSSQPPSPHPLHPQRATHESKGYSPAKRFLPASIAAILQCTATLWQHSLSVHFTSG